MTELSLINLTKVYDSGITAVSDLTLTVKSGELLVLLGPSGSGKTTALRLIAGLLSPTRGDLCFDGRSILPVPPEKREAVMVFQDHQLFPFRSVGDNVAFGLRLRRLDRATIRRRVMEALAAVRLPDFASRWPAELSGGQRQRVALARALVVRPKVLLLDEPLSNLDRELRQELRQMIRTLQQEAGITTLFVTHDQAEAVAIADRVALLLNGRLRQVGPPRDFYEKPADAQVARFFGGTNFLRGVKAGRLVQTDVGPLQVAPNDLPDGEVLLTIRPEAIEIGGNGHNNLPAQVWSYDYRGLVAQCTAGVENVALQVIASPFQTYREGEPVILHLPRERICLFPGAQSEVSDD